MDLDSETCEKSFIWSTPSIVMHLAYLFLSRAKVAVSSVGK